MRFLKDMCTDNAESQCHQAQRGRQQKRQTGQMRPWGGSTPSLERQDGFTAAEQRETGVGRGDLREHRVSSGSGHGDSIWALGQSHFILSGGSLKMPCYGSFYSPVLQPLSLIIVGGI